MSKTWLDCCSEVVWEEIVYGIKFIVVRHWFSGNNKTEQSVYYLFKLPYKISNTMLTYDVSPLKIYRAFSKEEREEKGNITEYFGKAISEEVKNKSWWLYHIIESCGREKALRGVYIRKEIFNEISHLDRFEVEELGRLLVESHYLKSFFTTSRGYCFQTVATNKIQKIIQKTFPVVEITKICL